MSDNASMTSFEPGEQLWTERLGNLRNIIRQEVIGRQIADHIEPGMTVLDVGCGQGTQGLRLAEQGCIVTGIDPSQRLLAEFDAGATTAGCSVELHVGSLDDLDALIGQRRFDAVCAHGLLMYLDDRAAAIARLAERAEPGTGRLSITVRNGHALAMRPALRRDWPAAIAAFDTTEYVNELGLPARADLIDDVASELDAVGMTIIEWYGVRVFNDDIAPEAAPPTGHELDRLLDAEDMASRRDPYRWLGSQMHLVAAPISS
jgi:S-adenosylmethionine-dependent methyltransferase